MIWDEPQRCAAHHGVPEMNWYFNHANRIDPGIGLAAALIVWFSPHLPAVAEALSGILTGNRSVLYGTIASIAGSLLGFSIAAVTIVLTVVQSPRLHLVRASKHYGKLWNTYHSTIWWLGATTVAGLVSLAVDRDNGPVLGVTAILALCVGTSGLRVLNAIWILEQIIRVATGGEAHGEKA